MKKIESINQYLLERYPNLWNTKLVWMLIIGFVLHCLFFAFGYYTHMSPESMQVYNVSNDFFDNGVFSVQLIISILLLTAWLVFMFKNNAFKSFYPISRGQLFGQFFQYVMIFFVSISFYFSYMYGLKVIVLQKYSPEIMQKDIKKINLGAAFLSQDFDKYAISKKAYPEVLQQLYCETSIENIDPNQKTFHFLNFDYQFYSIKKISVLKGTENSVCEDLVPNDSLQNNYLYSSTLNDSCEFYYKDKVIDISPYIKTSGLSYYNYSTVFYTNEDINVRSNAAYYAYENNVNLYTNSIAESQMNKKVSEILDSKNPELFKKTLSDFLEVSRRYKIDTNLTVDSWMKFAYHPDFFEVKHLIPIYYNGNYGEDGYREVVDSASGVATVVNAQTIDTYIKKQTLNNYYYRSDLLLQFLRNVDSVTNNNFINHNLHIYIWLSFTLAVIIFSIRITNIRNFIFSTITGGLIAILISIIVFFIGFNGVNQDLYIYVFIACLYLLIASVPILFMKPGRKLFYSILMTITISCFAPFLYLLVMIAGKVLKDKNGYPVDYFLLSFSDSTISIIIFLLSILFLFFYMGIVKKWKALPE